MADRFGVKLQVVRSLMKDLGKQSSGIIKKRHAEIRKVREHVALEGVISENIMSKEYIWSSEQIQAQVKEIAGIEVSKRAVADTFKKKFKLSYRQVKRVSFSGNSEHNRVLRSLYA